MLIAVFVCTMAVEVAAGTAVAILQHRDSGMDNKLHPYRVDLEYLAKIAFWVYYCDLYLIFDFFNFLISVSHFFENEQAYMCVILNWFVCQLRRR